MKIVHIAPNAPYSDGWGYQDNLLPKYQSKLGHQVVLVVSDLTHSETGICKTEATCFRSIDGFDVIRLPYKKRLNTKLTEILSYINVYPVLDEEKPEFIFYHGLISTTFYDVIKYKNKCVRTNTKCVVVQDNHLDQNIGIKASALKLTLLKAYYRHLNRRTQHYTECVYGVTPWRKKYAEEFFGISPDKTDVLIMGADDEKIDLTNRYIIRKTLRNKFGIAEKDFLIISGGKLDRRKNIIQLMKAVALRENIKLIVFGSVCNDIEREFNLLLNSSKNIKYIGWVASDSVYDYFFSAELVFFPGQHSVLWEQACASKIPGVFLDWNGMRHVDVGGNAAFINTPSVEEIGKMLDELHFTEKYKKMKAIADSVATDVFLYSRIAEKSLEHSVGKGSL